MLSRFFAMVRRLLDRLFCSRPAPALETSSDPMITMECKPRRGIEEPPSGAAPPQTFSEPVATMESHQRRPVA